MGTLYLVATPIGNLEDITLRALRILKEARLIAAEDTRQTRRLLSRYEIQGRLISYHEHNKITRLDLILKSLEEGDVALVSDAGTPGLNDPGYELVRAALDAGFTVSPAPGPAAPIAALVASGLPTDAFLYLGYLPRKASERIQLLREAAEEPYTLIFLETPHRLQEALGDMEKVLGERRAVAARELTKVYEEFLRGTLRTLREHFAEVEPRGEFTLVIEGAKSVNRTWQEQEVEEALIQGAGDAPPAKLVEQIASHAGWKKKDVYRKMIELKKKS